MFGCWQQPHAAALAMYWGKHKLWELLDSGYDFFYEQHASAAHAAVMSSECKYPSVFTQADIARALHMLHCSYRVADCGGAKGTRASPGWGFFKHGIVADPLKTGEVFPVLSVVPDSTGAVAVGDCAAGFDSNQGDGSEQARHVGTVQAAPVAATVCVVDSDRRSAPACSPAIHAPAAAGPSNRGWHGPAAGSNPAWVPGMSCGRGSNVRLGTGMMQQQPALAGRAGEYGVANVPQLMFVRVPLALSRDVVGGLVQQCMLQYASESGRRLVGTPPVVDLVASRVAIQAAVDSGAVATAGELACDSCTVAAVHDALHGFVVPSNGCIVILDWVLTPAVVHSCCALLQLPTSAACVLDLGKLPLSYMEMYNGLGCEVESWVAARCAADVLPCECIVVGEADYSDVAGGSNLHHILRQVSRDLEGWLAGWCRAAGVAAVADVEADKVAIISSMQLPSSAVAAARTALSGKPLLALTVEQLRMVEAMWCMKPGDGRWLHASGVIGGGKTTCYEVFAAMAAAVGMSVVCTAQTNAGTAAVGGDKCLEALLELSYIRDRVQFFFSDAQGFEFTEEVMLHHIAAYLHSPDVRQRLEQKLKSPLSHLVIDEVSQVSKALMTLVILVVMLFRPDLNVIIGGDARQIPSPPESRNGPNSYFFQSEVWNLLGIQYCEVTKYLRDPQMADVVEAIAAGRNDPFIYNRLLPRFQDTLQSTGWQLPAGGRLLHVFTKNSDRNRQNAVSFEEHRSAAGVSTVLVPWLVSSCSRREQGCERAYDVALAKIENSIWKNQGLEPYTERTECRPYAELFVSQSVMFSHVAQCFVHDQLLGQPTQAPNLNATGKVSVMKGVVGTVVGFVIMPLEEVARLSRGDVSAGVGGVGVAAVHPKALVPSANYVQWPVVQITDKHGGAQSVVVPHITVRESRWHEGAKATAAVAFVPLHVAYAANCQQLQGVTLSDPNVYLCCDITNAHWLQGLGAVMVTRLTDFGRLVLRPPSLHTDWARHKRNWFIVDKCVMEWLQRCRATGWASDAGAAAPMNVLARKQRVLDALDQMSGWSLDCLNSSAAVLQENIAAARAAGIAGLGHLVQLPVCTS
jgi:hypothetical protein